MARDFTAKTVENLKPNPATRLEIPDPGLTGLYLVVQPSGRKSWAVRYRHAGRPRKFTLGRYPVLSLADARRSASEALQAIEHGRDPGAEKIDAKNARAEQTDRNTVEALMDTFAKRHLSTLRTGTEVRSVLQRYVISEWGKRDARTITKRDVIDLLDKILDQGKPTTANRVRAHLSKFFGWLADREVIDASPVLGVKPVAKERKRDRVFSDDEIRWFWRACEEVGQPWGPYGQLLLLTGQRRSEVAEMTEDEIDGNTWNLSADRTKNGRSHAVPLSTAAQAILGGTKRLKGPSCYIHTTNGKTPVSGLQKARLNVVKNMEQVASDERGEPVKIEHWTWHDLRRTAATGMARLGITVRVTEAVLNHVSGTGAGIVEIYQRYDYDAEKRQALDAWGRFVLQLVEGSADNVVQLESNR